MKECRKNRQLFLICTHDVFYQKSNYNQKITRDVLHLILNLVADKENNLSIFRAVFKIIKEGRMRLTTQTDKFCF